MPVVQVIDSLSNDDTLISFIFPRRSEDGSLRDMAALTAAEKMQALNERQQDMSEEEYAA